MTLSYDADGNETGNPGSTTPTSPARTSESYTARDQLTSLVASGSTRTSSYLGADETDLLSAGSTTYQNALLGLTSATTSGTTTSYIRTPAGTLVAARTSAASYYYLTDNIGSVVGMADNSGTKVAAYSYDPYGRQRSSNGSQATTNPFHYAAGLYNPATGLTKYGARYYDPITGRFTQPDPSGQEDNPYAYAGDNSVGTVDMTGLFSFSINASLCVAGACLQASVGADSAGNVNVSGGVGTGVGGSVGYSVDPNNYTKGFNGVTESVGCNVGPVNGSVSTSDGQTVNAGVTAGSSEGVGCSASVNTGYTV